MKRAGITLAALLFLTVTMRAEEALPVGSAGQVTMNWQKFNEMWTKMQGLEKKIEKLEHPENLPPVPFSITKAAYQGRVENKKVMISGYFDIDVFDPKNWVKIPFLPSSAAVSEARLDGQPVGIVEEDDFHTLVIKSPGRHILHVQFSLRAPEQEQAPQLQINLVPTPLTLLAMDFARPKLDVSVEPSQGVDLETIGDHTHLSAAIPPTSQVLLHWQQAVEQSNEPAKLYVETENLITLTEGSAKAHWTLNYNILHQGVRNLRILTPEAWNILVVSCDGLQEWKPVETPQGPAIDIRLAYAKKDALQVHIEAERSLGEKEDVLDIPRLKPIGIEREQGTIGIEAKGALELQVQESSALNPIDPQELPGSLWQEATQPILFAFRYTKPHTLTVSVKRHPEVAVLTTTVDDANAVTLITPRGQMITRIQYQVRNHLKQYLSLQLPEGAQLWSAFVAGTPVKPTQVENRTYRIPLAKSQIDGNGQAGFPVEVVYFLPVPKFGIAGYRQTNFPVPDAPVSRVLWSLYLPERYRFLHFGGDFEKGERANPISSLLGRAVVEGSGGLMDLQDEEREKDAAKKVKEDLKSMSFGVRNAALAMGAASEPFDKQAALEADMIGQQKPQALETGVFPVDFEVPASGQLFRFGQVMIVGQNPRVTMTFVHVTVIKALGVIFLGLLAGGIYRSRALLIAAMHPLLEKMRSLEGLIPRRMQSDV